MRNSKGQFIKGIHNNPETEFRKGLVPWNKGKRSYKECEGCKVVFACRPGTFNKTRFCTLSCSKKGKNNGLWRGGITPVNHTIRMTAKYKQWRIAVFERDNYTCQKCDVRGGSLNADHIKSFSLYPALRFDINNGRTLCLDCHRKTDTWGYHLGKGVQIAT